MLILVDRMRLPLKGIIVSWSNLKTNDFFNRFPVRENKIIKMLIVDTSKGSARTSLGSIWQKGGISSLLNYSENWVHIPLEKNH